RQMIWKLIGALVVSGFVHMTDCCQRNSYGNRIECPSPGTREVYAAEKATHAYVERFEPKYHKCGICVVTFYHLLNGLHTPNNGAEGTYIQKWKLQIALDHLGSPECIYDLKIKVIRCPEVSKHIQNGRICPEGLQLGHRYEIICNKGYDTGGFSAFRTCRRHDGINGRWQPITRGEECKRNTCDKMVPVDDNAIAVCSGITGNTRTDKCSFRCNNGYYVLNGEPTVAECRVDLTWSNRGPRCGKKVKPVVRNPPSDKIIEIELKYPIEIRIEKPIFERGVHPKNILPRTCPGYPDDVLHTDQRGTYVIRCSATDDITGLSASHSYTILVKSNTADCVQLAPPPNGALVCDQWLFGMYCQLYCAPFSHVPVETYISKGIFICAGGSWDSRSLPTCSASGEPSQIRRVDPIMTFRGQCNLNSTKNSLKERFLTRLMNSPHRLLICPPHVEALSLCTSAMAAVYCHGDAVSEHHHRIEHSQETLIDQCFEHKCEFGSTCKSVNNNYTCFCTDGFRGDLCEQQMVNGGWTFWSEWSDCNKECGNGTRERFRTCTYPEPANGGIDCVGDKSEHQNCKNDCPVCRSLKQPSNGFIRCNPNIPAPNKGIECTVGCNRGFGFSVEIKRNIFCGAPTNFSWQLEETSGDPERLPECTGTTKSRGLAVFLSFSLDGQFVRSDIAIVNSSIHDKLLEFKEHMPCLFETCIPAVGIHVEPGTRKNNGSGPSVTSNLEITITVHYIGTSYEYFINAIKVASAYISEQNETLLSMEINNTTIVTSSYTSDSYVECPVGYAVDGNDLTLCSRCQRGTFYRNHRCNICHRGFYQPDEGQTFCLHCPVNTTTPCKGAKNIDECIFKETTP
ncbi:unnamed protein product, partial [Owenia fusiformis]